MKVKISSRCTGQAFALAVLLFLITASPARAQEQPPELFTYAELVQLYENKDLPEALQVKLDRLLTTPFISNGFCETSFPHRSLRQEAAASFRTALRSYT